MQKTQLNSKSISRIAAIQTIYQYNNEASDITNLLTRMIEFYKDKDALQDLGANNSDNLKMKPSYNYLSQLVQYTHENFDEINEIISDFLVNKEKIQTMSKLLLSLLQVAICELKFFPETPKKVVINEFTDIANDMLESNEIGFVNSMLDNFSSK